MMKKYMMEIICRDMDGLYQFPEIIEADSPKEAEKKAEMMYNDFVGAKCEREATQEDIEWCELLYNRTEEDKWEDKIRNWAEH